MTTFDEMTSAGATGAGFAGRAARAAGRFAAEVRRRREIARSERHLREMPDSMLKDIGIHRSEISAIVRFGQVGYGG